MSVTDGESPPDSLGKEKKRSSKVVILTVILVAVLMLGAITGLIGHIGNSDELPAPLTTIGTSAGILYATHNPIDIGANFQFTNADSGIVSGNGTTSNPYIIAGWDINASATTGISIRHTDAHFMIRNCYVHDGTSSHDGIYLDTCVNGSLVNNTCLRNHDGIGLASSSGITVSDNNCSSNTNAGVNLISSSHDTVTNNACILNTYEGIYLSWGGAGGLSSNNTLSNNTCSKSQYGIDVGYVTYDNTLSYNTCRSNYYAGIHLGSSRSNMLRNNNCSSNGNGIYLEASNNIMVANNTCNSNSNSGIYLEGSSHNMLIDNTCSNDHTGIILDQGPFVGSNTNEVFQNLVCNNTGYGAYIEHGIEPDPRILSSNNRIWNNTFIGNNGATDAYDASHVQAYDDGTNNSWNGTDGYGNWWSDWSSPDSPYVISGSGEAKDNHPLVTTQTPLPKPSIMPFVEMVLIAVFVGVFLIVIVLAREARRKNRSPP